MVGKPRALRAYIRIVGLIAPLLWGVGCRTSADGRLGGVGVPAPTKAIGVMFNFPPEDGSPAKTPAFFLRAAGAISGPGDTIVIPKDTETILYEGELVVVVGKRASRVSEVEAAACIRGYTCGMDGSPVVLDASGERDSARSLFGKSYDGVAPIGPRLVPELDPAGHSISIRVNGEKIGASNTKDMIWQPARLISEISKVVALEPGDVIYCGTNRPIPKLQPGDRVEVEIEGIGVLTNRVVKEGA